MQEMEKAVVTHSSILAWEIPWKEKLGGLSPWGHKRVRHDLVTKQHIYPYEWYHYILLG